MPSQDPETPDPLLSLRDAVSLIEDAIALVEEELAKNPAKDDERKLRRTLTELTAKRAIVDAKITALLDKSRQIAGPTAVQVAAVASLSGQVEDLTNASRTGSATVALTSKVLALATEIASA
jgi:hypothetical protein